MRERSVWTPVLMLTAKDGEYDQTDAFDLGADDYLTKPFSFLVLVARLRALIRRGAPERPVVLTAGDLILDPGPPPGRADGTGIRLTPPRVRPARSTSCVIAARRVNKTQILEHVWDPAFDGDPNIVEVYIRYLRRKIDAPFDRHAIETIRGLGYRLDPDGG